MTAARISALLCLVACPAYPDSVDVVLNDNRKPAGRLQAGVLTVSLVARRGIWHPEGSQAPGIEVPAFAVENGALTNPGPLLRVPAGTEIRASVRNTLLSPLTVHGLGSQVLLIPPGEARKARFVAEAPGTFFFEQPSDLRLEAFVMGVIHADTDIRVR